jgi:hypothetical protein
MSSEVISMDGVYAENCLEQFQYNQTYIRPSISNRVVECKVIADVLTESFRISVVLDACISYKSGCRTL